jgi:NAD(P)-dependent dehydrogenase (short-subunit alcohol dehydrogenase family)
MSAAMAHPLSNELQGLRVLITGAASGIGAVTAEWMAQRGAAVVGVDLHPAAASGSIRVFGCDVRDDASVRQAMEAATSALGGLDVLVNNAGIAALGTLDDQTDDDWLRVFDVNLFGMVRATRAALPWLRQSRHAAIVNTSSAVAPIGLPNRALYSATKGAILSMTRAWAADYIQVPIRVNCVTPGVVDTPWQARAVSQAQDPAQRMAQLKALQPSGVLVTPQQVAAAITYLASPASGATTGIDLPVDGGMQTVHLMAAALAQSGSVPDRSIAGENRP